jgi:hypothetical protein
MGEDHKIKAPPRATVAKAMAPLRKGSWSWMAPFFLGDEEVELEGAVVVEVVELVLLLVDPDKPPENCVMSVQRQSRAEQARARATYCTAAAAIAGLIAGLRPCIPT